VLRDRRRQDVEVAARQRRADGRPFRPLDDPSFHGVHGGLLGSRQTARSGLDGDEHARGP